MNVRDLDVKFTAYAHYINTREWAREGASPSWLLCVAPDVAQERRVQRVAQGRLACLAGCMLWTTTVELLNERGPLAPIWSLGFAPTGQMASSSGSLRHCVFHKLPR